MHTPRHRGAAAVPRAGPSPVIIDSSFSSDPQTACLVYAIAQNHTGTHLGLAGKHHLAIHARVLRQWPSWGRIALELLLAIL